MARVNIEKIANVVDLAIHPSPNPEFVEPKLLLKSVHLKRDGRCNARISPAGPYEDGFSVKPLLKFDLLRCRFFAADKQRGKEHGGTSL
jgi:hypothetical protein